MTSITLNLVEHTYTQWRACQEALLLSENTLVKWLLRGEGDLYGSSLLGYQNPLGNTYSQCGGSALYVWFTGVGDNHHSPGQYRTAPWSRAHLSALLPINFDLLCYCVHLGWQL